MENFASAELIKEMAICLMAGFISSIFAAIRITTKVLIGDSAFKISIAVGYCLSGFTVGVFVGSMLPMDNKHWLGIVIVVGYYSVTIIDVGSKKITDIFDKYINKI